MVGDRALLLFKSSSSLSIHLPIFSTFTLPNPSPKRSSSPRPLSNRTVKMSSSDHPEVPPPSSSSSAASAVDFLTLCHRLKVILSNPNPSSFSLFLSESFSHPSLDHEKSGLGAPRSIGTGVDSGPHVSDGSYGSRRSGDPWCRS